MFVTLWMSCHQNQKRNGVQSQEEVRRDIDELMKIHAEGRVAHFSKNADLMVNGFADNFISVNRGKIDSLSRNDHKTRIQQYFDAVEFKKWDDLNPPVIRFSDDHSLAYMIVDKLVVLDVVDSSGNKSEEQTHFAWTSIFRKQPNSGWVLECVTSTQVPD
jgi:hypothetical protein